MAESSGSTAGGRTPPVLVAVVSWNTRQLLDECLVSLRPLFEAGHVDVRVVDNASDDGSAELVRGSHAWARLLHLAENVGFGRAVNLAVREDGGDWRWIAVANADVALEDRALEALLAAARADPAAGILAPRLVLPDGTTQHSVHPFPTLPAATAFNLGLPRVFPGLGRRLCLERHWDPDEERRVPWAIGAFLLVRRETWDATGGFDERHFMYAEDLDLGWRAGRSGYPTRYVPAARVRHHSAAATSRAWGETRVDRWQAATYAWVRRRRGLAPMWAYAALNVAGAAARWAMLAVLARRRPERHAWFRDYWHAWTRRHVAALRSATVDAHGDPPTSRSAAPARPLGR